MFNVGNLIKQHLLTDVTLSSLIGSKIYNLVVFTSEDSTIKPPYLVVEINSLSPNYTKEYFTYSELTFSVIVLASKYIDLKIISEAVKSSLEFKGIADNEWSIDSIEFDSYTEQFELNFELYGSKLTFSSKVFKK